MSRITDIGCHHCLKYTQIQKIGEPNNLRDFGSMKNKGNKA
jgi:hypothetical protein